MRYTYLCNEIIEVDEGHVLSGDKKETCRVSLTLTTSSKEWNMGPGISSAFVGSSWECWGVVVSAMFSIE